jgi:ParB family chromosome partitioning protein
MSGRKKDRGLGRGLSALMSDLGATENEAPITDKKSEPDAAEATKPSDAQAPANPKGGVYNVGIDRLKRNPDQPRKVFEAAAMDDLVASIQQKGVLQPVLVRELIDGSGKAMGYYQIVAGERRWQAALKAGLSSIPVLVRHLSDRDVLEIGVIENVQRADLNPMEEALAYDKLIHEFGRTQAEIAQSIGKSRVYIANTTRLTSLTRRGQELLMQGQISAGHARALLMSKDPDALAEAIVANNWSVREAERHAKAELAESEGKGRKTKAPKPSDILTLEQRIQDRTGYAADIRQKGLGGELRLKYKDLDSLEALIKQLGAGD